MTTAFAIRDGLDSDMPAIQAIYEYHVLNGTASFEIEPPTLEQMCERRKAVLATGLPYLVAERDGEPLGYAYATLYRPRLAYRFTCEDSVYVKQGLHRQGIGRKLLEVLIDRCAQGGWRQMIAVIGDANPASIAVHESQGFELAGTLKSVGYKFDGWRATIFMQKSLGLGDMAPPESV